jgi:FlaG/FlaF family flagellin (archaellin)
MWSRDKRALSPIFATVLLASIIIIFGSVAYYYTSNLTTDATNNYVKTLSDSQQAMSERIGFENVFYDGSTNPVTLKIYIINCGIANNVQIGSVFLYNTASHNLVGQPIQGSTRSSVGSFVFPLFTIDGGASIQSNSLNKGDEGYFTVPLSGALQSGTSYTIHLVTQSGSAFDYEFAT